MRCNECNLFDSVRNNVGWCTYEHKYQNKNHLGCFMFEFKEESSIVRQSIKYNIKPGIKYSELKFTKIRVQLGENGYNIQTIDKIVLILEELLTNILKHSNCNEDIKVAINLHSKSVKINIDDTGREFHDPDLTLSVEDREGGLGIHLVRKLSDDLQYNRLGNHNITSVFLRTGDERLTDRKYKDKEGRGVDSPDFNIMKFAPSFLNHNAAII